MKKDTQEIARELQAYAEDLSVLGKPTNEGSRPPDIAPLEREKLNTFLESLKNPAGGKKIPRAGFKKWWWMLAAPSAVAAIVVLLLLPAADMHLVAQTGGRVERGFDPTTLPQEMDLNLKKLRLTLASAGDRLEGTLTPLASESTPEEEVFQVVLTGLDRDKVKGSFTGRIRIVRKVTAAPIKAKQDIGKVIVEGDFRVGDQAAQPVSRAYQP